MKGIEGKKEGYDYTQGEGSLQIRTRREDILRKESISRDSSQESLPYNKQMFPMPLRTWNSGQRIYDAKFTLYDYEYYSIILGLELRFRRGYKEDIRGRERLETQPRYLPLLLNSVRLCNSPLSRTISSQIQDLGLANGLRYTSQFLQFFLVKQQTQITRVYLII